MTAALAVVIREIRMSYMTVSDAARRLDANPRDISDLFYRRQLRDDLAPIVGGRRMIPEEMLEVIRLALKRNGKHVAKGVLVDA
jgi:hypothetical protein